MVILFVQDVDNSFMGLANVFFWVTGRGLHKIQHNLSNNLDIKCVHIVNKSYNVNKDAIPWYVNVNKNSVMYVDRNGYPIIKLMEIRLAQNSSRFKFSNNKNKNKNKIKRNISKKLKKDLLNLIHWIKDFRDCNYWKEYN